MAAAVSTRPVPELASSRYELHRPLGKGGAGTVYLALDRETGEEVALKRLSRVDPRSVQRFKREFRSLADLHHPNLVKLYDLQHDGAHWFLTMEYVEGADLGTTLAEEYDVYTSGTVPANDNGSSPARITRIARAFHQLALGVQAVHRAGMLHHDLKPSNVVVSSSGRVVVLDFGLVRELGRADENVALEGTVAGTPAYMAPEQASGLPLTAAADWYAFGVMLYETLSGFLPFEAKSAVALVQRKLKQDAPPLPAELGPRPLLDLCMQLLARDPSARPDGDAIISVLLQVITACSQRPQPSAEGVQHTARQRGAEVRADNDTVAPAARAELFGRRDELAKLYEALAHVRDDRSAIVHVRGMSGSGKTSLIEHFLDELQESPGLYGRPSVVLRSRCYEREAMPFKALDGVIDELVSHLAKLEDHEVAHILPGEIQALTQVFPAFERLRVVHALMAKGRSPRGDAAATRRQAERALRELFIHLAKVRSLVLWIDDLHWGDLDSASLLQDWLIRPAEAPILFLLSYRSDEIETSSCLRQLVPAARASAPELRFELDVNPLRDAEIERLCQQRLGSAAPLIDRIVAEAHGNPFLALQLTALARAKLDRGELDLDALSVGELVMRTSAMLSDPAKALLCVLAVAGRPLVPQLALGAAGVHRDGRAHIHALQSLRLVRTRLVDGVRLLEVYHDRVREAIGVSLSAADSTRLHERLLRAIESSGSADPSWLHALALGAGQRRLALRYGESAAQIASSSLAFERAAELYASCLTLTDSPDELAALWTQAGLALARCRRGAQAADAYLKASEYAHEPDRIGLLQKAASHLVRSGRFEEGERLVQRVMQALRIEIPSTRAGMYAAIAWERARYALYARTVKPQLGIPLPADELRRGEFYGTIAVWTAIYAPLRAALFQARVVRMAFQHGELLQMARTMCLTAAIESLSGTSAAASRAEAQLAMATELTAQLDDPTVQVELLSTRATCALMLGRLRDAIEPSYSADEIYDKKSTFDDTGDYYHMFSVRTVRIGALQALGRHKQAIQELREILATARATDNLTAILQLSGCVTRMEEVLEGCARSRERLDWERTRLPQGETGILHLMNLTGVLRSAAMTGDFDWAQAVLEQMWPGFEASPVRRSAYLSYLLNVSLARFQLNRYVVRGESGDPERIVKRCLRFLSSRAPEPLRKPARARLSARIAYLRGDRTLAKQLLGQSIAYHEELGLRDDAARELYAFGCLTAGDDGDKHKRDALATLADCGVAQPEADVRAYYPELFDVCSRHHE